MTEASRGRRLGRSVLRGARIAGLASMVCAASGCPDEMPAPEASLPAPRDAGDARELEAATPRPSERDELPPLVPDREVHAAELATLLDDAMPYFARRAPLAFAWMRASLR